MTVVRLVPPERQQDDPRLAMEPGALAAANTNAFPVVGRHVQRRDQFGVVAGVVCAVLLGGVTFWTMTNSRQATAPAAPMPYVEPHSAPPAVRAVPAPAMVPPVEPKAEIDTNRINAPTLVVDGATAVVPVVRNGVEQPETPPEKGDHAAAPSSDVAVATPMSDPAHTVVQGTIIAAVLETALDSDLPGYARAIVSGEVKSFDGSRVLISRGSHLIGQYKSGLANGQRRAYILWSRLIRPDGVSVPLASPATDFSGATGLAGEVDTHFFARFGSALLLSSVNLLSTLGTGGIILSSAPNAATQGDTQIPPTVKVLPGTPIRVFTARDLDFSAIAPDGAPKK